MTTEPRESRSVLRYLHSLPPQPVPSSAPDTDPALLLAGARPLG